MPPTVFAGYTLEALIGRGGMAEVYRARRPGSECPVAVKRLAPALARDPGYVALFDREARILRHLKHPAIVEVHEAGISGGTPFIAMEHVDGRNLRQVLVQCAKRSIRLPVPFAAYVGHVLADALAYAHAAMGPGGEPLGIVHCDVSPSNVFISRVGEVKLGDFGVAQTTAGGASGSGFAFGKVRYLAPEQIRGEPLTARADVFGLGAVLFELLANEPAFPGQDADEIGRRILSGERRAPSALRPDVPADLDMLVVRALSPRAEERPASAAFRDLVAASYDPAIGTPLAIAAVVRGLFG